MTRFLASVRDTAEALLAAAGGADLIDFKDPDHGALGALDPRIVIEARGALAARAPSSATAGDWPLEPGRLAAAAQACAATGVDYVKLGLSDGEALAACIDGLRAVAARTRLVAVFFADRGVPLEALPRLRAAGFCGAMIDTFDKAGGGLRAHLDEDKLAAFIRRARDSGLLCGLAGSLGAEDVAPLVRLAPDLLGFRGALCTGTRASALSLQRVRAVRQLIDDAQRSRSSPRR